MRFLGILFLFSPSWQLQHISPEKILNFSSQQRLGKNFKLNHFNQQVLTERHAFSFGRQTPRNDEIKEIFDEPAKILCAEFYMKHYGNSTTSQSYYVANGAESAIYRCFTEENIEFKDIPSETALKIYFISDPMAKAWHELEAIDAQLTEQNARYPVYEWVYKPEWPIRAKFEQFLSDKKDFQDEGFHDPLARDAIIREMAKVHSASVDGINKQKHRTFQVGAFQWNTYYVQLHIELIFWIMNPPPSQDIPIWGGTDQKVYDAFGLTKDQYWEEVKFTEETLQTYFDTNPETPILCHNDIHTGNVMRNTEGVLNPDEVILVDFDQTHYGFRMWDILYFLTNWDVPSDEEFEKIIQTYINYQTYNETLAMSTMLEEKDHMLPYVMLERLTFIMATGIGDTIIEEFGDEYIKVMRGAYADSLKPFGRTLPVNEDSSAMILSISFFFKALILMIIFE